MRSLGFPKSDHTCAPGRACRTWLSLAAALVFGVMRSHAAAPAAARPVAPEFQEDKVDVAVDKGIAFLVRNQERTGYFMDKERGKQQELAKTALALMAFASVGHMPADYTPEGRAMDRGLNIILRPGDRNAATSGYYGSRDASSMYGHGIVTLALTEFMGMGKDRVQDKLIRDRSMAALDVILRAQQVKKHNPRFQGGWRYQPTATDSDLSVSVWQVMALRSGNNAGISIPQNAINGAAVYLRRSYYSARDNLGRPTKPVSGFGYQPGSAPNFPMTSAGLLALQVIGAHRLPEVEGAGKWLLQQKISYEDSYFFYGGYYYCQAMKKLGGEYASTARQTMEAILLANQDEDGSWTGGNSKEQNLGRIYSTALGILCLSVKYGHLPIYQD